MKINMIALCLLMPLAGLAQIEKGTQLVGANVSLNSKNVSSAGKRDAASSSYNLNLRYGRFIAENVAIGLSVPLTYSKLEQQSELNWGAGPFIRYYSPFEDSKMNLLIELRTTYNESKFEDKALPLKVQTQFIGVGGGFGLVYFFNESIGLETLLDYTYLESLNNSNKSGGFSLNMGFQIYLNKFGF